MLLFTAPWAMNNSTPPYYSLTDPIMIPVTKYFCRNGYTQSIGATAITMAAVWIDSVVVAVFAWAAAEAADELIILLFMTSIMR